MHISILVQKKLERQRTDLDFCGTRNWNDVVALAKKPRERNLASRCVVFLTNLCQSTDKFEDVWKVLLGEPGRKREPKTT